MSNASNSLRVADATDAAGAAAPVARYRVMQRCYDRAMQDFPPQHRSQYWDHFRTDFRDNVIDPEKLRNFRSNALVAGMTSNRDAVTVGRQLSERETSRLRRAWESLVATVGVEFARETVDGETGNPRCAVVDGVKLNHADLRLVYNAWRLGRLLPADDNPAIVEIGGGYGGLAGKLKKLWRNATILIFDLPEANAIQHWYLSELFPQATIATYEDVLARGMATVAAERPDFALLPGWCIEGLPERAADIVVNTRSFMEMNAETIAFYFRHLQRALRPGGLFYCVNRYSKPVAGKPNRLKDYPFDARWYPVHSAPAWDQPWVHELALVRTRQNADGVLRRELQALPPAGWSDVRRHAGLALQALHAVVVGTHRSVNPGIAGWVRNEWHRTERRAVAALSRWPRARGFLRRMTGRKN